MPIESGMKRLRGLKMGRMQCGKPMTETSARSTEIDAALAQLAKAHGHAGQLLQNAERLLAERNRGRPAGIPSYGKTATHGNAALPHWDPATHTLRLGNKIVKQYRVPSPNQETVLAVFQEEGWPPRIDDPLPPVADGLPRDRLRNTIRSLNSSQKNRFLRFRGDGTGEGICWERAPG